MATATIAAVEIDDDGYDIIGSTDFETLVAGTGNGVEFEYNPNDLIILKNTVASVANFDILVPTPTPYSTIGVTIPDDSVQLAAGDTTEQYWVHKIFAPYRQSAGTVIIECDVAGEVLVLRK